MEYLMVLSHLLVYKQCRFYYVCLFLSGISHADCTHFGSYSNIALRCNLMMKSMLHIANASLMQKCMLSKVQWIILMFSRSTGMTTYLKTSKDKLVSPCITWYVVKFMHAHMNPGWWNTCQIPPYLSLPYSRPEYMTYMHTYINMPFAEYCDIWVEGYMRKPSRWLAGWAELVCRIRAMRDRTLHEGCCSGELLN